MVNRSIDDLFRLVLLLYYYSEGWNKQPKNLWISFRSIYSTSSWIHRGDRFRCVYMVFRGVVGLACGALQVGFDQCSTVDGISDCIRRSQIGGIVFSIIFLLVELSFLYLSFWIATNRIKMRVFKRSKSTRGSTRGSRSTQSNSNQTGPQDEMSLDDMSNSGENKSSITQ